MAEPWFYVALMEAAAFATLCWLYYRLAFTKAELQRAYRVLHDRGLTLQDERDELAETVALLRGAGQ